MLTVSRVKLGFSLRYHLHINAALKISKNSAQFTARGNVIKPFNGFCLDFFNGKQLMGTSIASNGVMYIVPPSPIKSSKPYFGFPHNPENLTSPHDFV